MSSKPIKLTSEVYSYSRVLKLDGSVIGHLRLANSTWRYEASRLSIAELVLLDADVLRAIANELDRLNAAGVGPC